MILSMITNNFTCVLSFYDNNQEVLLRLLFRRYTIILKGMLTT